MLIRPADEHDAEALARLATETFTETYRGTMLDSDLEDHVARHLSRTAFDDLLRHDAFLVAEHDGELVGFAQFGEGHVADDKRDRGDQALRRLYVRSRFHGAGVGAALMEAALECAAMKAAPRIWLDVWEHNHRARRFYESYGFEVAGKFRMEFDSGPADSLDLVMVRRQS
jgi:ribosomal protein S18 acetylase RimI-like enzyme